MVAQEALIQAAAAAAVGTIQAVRTQTAAAAAAGRVTVTVTLAAAVTVALVRAAVRPVSHRDSQQGPSRLSVSQSRGQVRKPQLPVGLPLLLLRLLVMWVGKVLLLAQLVLAVAVCQLTGLLGPAVGALLWMTATMMMALLMMHTGATVKSGRPHHIHLFNAR